LAPSGQLFLKSGEHAVRADSSRQSASVELLALTAPYNTGPDLVKPGRGLRIIPGKLHGEPHVENTRVTTATIYEWHKTGYSNDEIRALYPSLSESSVREAIDLEHRLHRSAA
jgi:uncharacterized protein (DUF433 family)